VQIETSAALVPNLDLLLRLAPMRHAHSLWLAACATGLSCSLTLAGSMAAQPAQARPLLAQTAVEKASPFAGAKDETSPAAEAAPAAVTPTSAAAGEQAAVEPLKQLAGTKAAGTKKNSPFAAAKESDEDADTDLKADRTRLWWLLLPVGLAAISYGVLKAQEGEAEA
jgi:hypothetical protein